MTRSDEDFSVRSQNSTSAKVEMVTVDRRTLKRILSLIGRCCDDVDGANHCEVMLYALDSYLTEQKNPQVDKAILFLRYWLHVVPELLQGVDSALEEAHTVLKAVLDGSK